MQAKSTTYLPLEILLVEKKRVISIPYLEILTIKCEKPFLKIILKNQTIYIDNKLHNFCSGLPDYFIQTNRSQYINLLNVVKIITGQIYVGNMVYQISRRRLKDVENKFIKYKKELLENNTCHLCKWNKNNK